MSNPWNLLPRKMSVLSSLSEHGCSKLVARELEISPKTVDTHMERAKEKMGVRNRLKAVVMWDRWHGRQQLPDVTDMERMRFNAALLHKLQQQRVAA